MANKLNETTTQRNSFFAYFLLWLFSCFFGLVFGLVGVSSCLYIFEGVKLFIDNIEGTNRIYAISLISLAVSGPCGFGFGYWIWQRLILAMKIVDQSFINDLWIQDQEDK